MRVRDSVKWYALTAVIGLIGAGGFVLPALADDGTAGGGCFNR